MSTLESGAGCAVDYPVDVDVEPAIEDRNRLTTAFRIILAIYPEGLYHFGVGVLRWSTRVEAYLLLLRGEYPPFSLA